MTTAELHSTLTLFNPFLARQFMPLREEAEVNKAWHLGRKEFVYQQTLLGHIPFGVGGSLEPATRQVPQGVSANPQRRKPDDVTAAPSGVRTL